MVRSGQVAVPVHPSRLSRRVPWCTANPAVAGAAADTTRAASPRSCVGPRWKSVRGDRGACRGAIQRLPAPGPPDNSARINCPHPQQPSCTLLLCLTAHIYHRTACVSTTAPFACRWRGIWKWLHSPPAAVPAYSSPLGPAVPAALSVSGKKPSQTEDKSLPCASPQVCQTSQVERKPL